MAVDAEFPWKEMILQGCDGFSEPHGSAGLGAGDGGVNPQHWNQVKHLIFSISAGKLHQIPLWHLWSLLDTQELLMGVGAAPAIPAGHCCMENPCSSAGSLMNKEMD